jgi:hypothetical protein
MAPNIGAIASYIKGQITKDLDVQIPSLHAQALPLSIKMPLKKLLLQKGLSMLKPPLSQSSRLLNSERMGPRPPRQTVVLITQHHEIDVVRQPVGLIDPPALKLLMAGRGLLRPSDRKRTCQCCSTPVSKLKVQCSG